MGATKSCSQCGTVSPLPVNPLSVGYVLDDFAIGSAIGAGRHGTIYRVQHLPTGTPAALRVPDDNLIGGPENATEFLAQLARFTTFAHPHLARILFAGQLDRVCFYVMEYLPGGSLADRLQHGPLDEKEALRLLKQLADALDYLHEQKFIPRELTPAQVMFDDNANAKWCDLLLPPPVGGVGDARANLYSLGALAFEMVTGRPPDADPSEPVPAPAGPVPLSPTTTALIQKLLAKNPAHRFQSVAELLTALRATRPPVRQAPTVVIEPLGSDSTPAARPAPAYSLPKQPQPALVPMPSHPLRTLVGWLAVLGILIGAVWWWQQQRPATPDQPPPDARRAGITITPSNGEYFVLAPGYHARVGHDGCLHSFVVDQTEILDDKIGSSRGAYFGSNTRRGIELPQVTVRGATVIATDGEFTAGYAFDVDGVVVSLQQHATDRPKFTVTTSAAFVTVRDRQTGAQAATPTTNEWREVRFEAPNGIWLELRGSGKLNRPWGEKKRQQNWTRFLKTGEDTKIALRVGQP